jgi:hypothetical protein
MVCGFVLEGEVVTEAPRGFSEGVPKSIPRDQGFYRTRIL